MGGGLRRNNGANAEKERIKVVSLLETEYLSSFTNEIYHEEHIGSVVECLIRGQRAASSSLTCVDVLLP